MKQKILLENEVVLLRSMTAEDVDAIFKVAVYEEIWPYLSTTIQTKEDVHSYVTVALSNKTAGIEFPFVIIDKSSGQLVGSTRFMDISVAHKRLEIGSTWITPQFWRTAINTNCKYLLLGYCFEQLNFQRVQIKTDNDNNRSKLAIARIGAKFEGVLRQHMIRKDGTTRDTAMFSVVESEWLETKQQLEQLLIRE